MSADAAAQKGRRPRRLRHDAQLIALLRQIALYEETARLLQARADTAATAAEAARFQRRANEHSDRVRRLRYKLQARVTPRQ